MIILALDKTIPEITGWLFSNDKVVHRYSDQISIVKML